MNEEIVIELLKQQWNFAITMSVLLIIVGGFLMLVGALFIRQIDDGVFARVSSYGFCVCSIVVFGIAGSIIFGGFYL